MGNRQSVEHDLQILVDTSGLNPNDVQSWYDEFARETNNSNRMNKRQFQRFYSHLRQRADLTELTDHIFRAFDIDQSGTIDFQEFLLAYIATSERSQREKFEYAFQVYDINENDSIEKKEAKKILELICRVSGLSQDDATTYTRTMMISFDQNHDKVLSKSEFIHGCLTDAVLAKISNPFLN